MLIIQKLVALLILIVLFPILLTIGFLVVISDGFPVLFRQIRMGKNGKPFSLYKFRTMVKDAENALLANPELLKKYQKQDYKLYNYEDPRIIKFGVIFRKWSLDELPQLLNILKGEMNFVGPRPVLSEEIKRYSPKEKLFLSVKPGITGLWQVMGRNKISYPDRRIIDFYYIKNKSFCLDCYIIIKTIHVIIFKHGSY